MYMYIHTYIPRPRPSPTMLLRHPTSTLLAAAATAALLCLLLCTEQADAFRLFGRTKSGARAAAPMRPPPHATAAGAAPAGPSNKGVVGRLLDKLNPLRIKDYECVHSDGCVINIHKWPTDRFLCVNFGR